MKLNSIFFKAVAFFTLIVFTMVACSSPFGNNSGVASPPRITTIDPFALFVDIEGNVVDDDTGRTIVIADEDLNVLIYTDNIAGSSTQRVAFMTDDASVIFYFERNQNFPSMVVLSDDEGDLIGYFTPYNSSSETFGLIFVDGEEKEVFLDIPFSREILNFVNDRELTARQNLRMRNLNVAMHLIIAIDEVLDLDDDTARSLRRWLRRAVVVVAVVAVVAVAVVAAPVIVKGVGAAVKWTAKKAAAAYKVVKPYVKIAREVEKIVHKAVYHTTGLNYRAAVVNAVLGGGTVVAPSPPAGGGGGTPPALPPAGGGGGGGGGSGAPPAQPALTGTVSITGTPQVGQTLTANTAGLGGTGAISFQWRRGTTNVGTNSNTHVVQATDVGANITVTVTRAGHSGSVTSPAVGPVAPASVTFSDATANGAAWQTTTQLTLTFDQDIIGIATNDITLSGLPGVVAGGLSGTGATRTLAISGQTSGGILTVTVRNLPGFNISPTSRTVTIFGPPTQSPPTFTYAVNAGEVIITGFYAPSPGGTLIIPASIETIYGERPVATIGPSAFRDNQLTSVTIPSSVTNIMTLAFTGNQLESITIPNSVTSIESGAFSNNWLTSITIPNSVSSIGTGVFSNNRLTSVTIPNSVSSIGQNAFRDNQLESVTIPNNVTSIGSYAFRNNQLESVTIPSNVTVIDDGAFMDNQLTSLTIPDGVISIGGLAFAFNQLANVTIPASVTSISGSAFLNEQLTSVTIPFVDLDAADATWGFLWRSGIPGTVNWVFAP